MSQALLQDNTDTRDIDPNVVQRRASNPSDCVWVSASAGTGKTKVLTDRVLRLLLPQEKGAKPGCDPHKILCLTFTKAAATEMLKRIQEKLSDWAIAADEDLQKDLKSLLGRDPENTEIQAARTLLARVIDAPGGIKIMTIHAFCQSLLARFPLEAGIAPYFSAAEESQSLDILKKSISIGLRSALEDENLKAALTRIASTINEKQFQDLLQNIVSERAQLKSLLQTKDIRQELFKTLDLDPDTTQEGTLQDLNTLSDAHHLNLRRCCTALGQSNATDQKRGIAIQNWLDADHVQKDALHSEYKSALLTQKDEPRKCGKFITDNHPDCADILIHEAHRILNYEDILKRLNCVQNTMALLDLGTHILDVYEHQKQKDGILDFDDLIFKTNILLHGQGEIARSAASWVLYKLDGGLNHILIDEAQDTNPEQWQIIQKLCEEFFTGEGQSDAPRTLFTVGDEKQSIYSFQRAAPEKFEFMRQFFEGKITEAKQNWRNEILQISFRSTQTILDVVDCVFTHPEMQKHLGTHWSNHISFRRGQAGLVELWPLIEQPAKQKVEPWQPPVKIIESQSAQTLLAQKIAKTIQNWIENGEFLESRGRPIRAGDILILVRTRTTFVAQLIRALKTKDIPVNGLDRMVLNTQICIQDLIAAAEFALLPDDDLTLACLLKSPFIGLSEDDLYAIAIDRESSLWESAQKKLPPNITHYLKNSISIAQAKRPYEFFHYILHTSCPNHKDSGLQALLSSLGEDIKDAIEEFMNSCLQFDLENIPTLQGFVQFHKKHTSDIKREQDEGSDSVRIMTVHGAKGLQAPIVILPDTTRTTKAPPGKSDARLLWPEKTQISVPLWAPRKDDEPAFYSKIFDDFKDNQDAEYKRLLYVALTRAEDRLYIGGVKSQKTLDDSWYTYIKAGMAELGPDTIEDGTLQISGVQTRDPDRRDKHAETQKSEKQIIPDWIFEPAPEEPFPPRPLVPSRPSDFEPSAQSPLSANDTYRFKRGNITHTLLQILPDLSPETWENAAQNYVAQKSHGLPEPIQNSIVEETLAILYHPEFAPIFGPGSMAEVPVTGLIGQTTLISGQIDRLLIREDGIWIIDYKTNRPPPMRVEDVPVIYQKQMKAYRDALSLIYPGRPVHTALLWTDGPRLMIINS